MLKKSRDKAYFEDMLKKGLEKVDIKKIENDDIKIDFLENKNENLKIKIEDISEEK